MGHDYHRNQMNQSGNWRGYVHNRVEGMSRAQAYIKAGYSPNGARSSAFKLEQQPHVQKYLAELRERAGVHAINVLRTLNRQMMADMADFLDEDGRLDLGYAREIGITDLIKSITYHEKSGGIRKLELYDAQGAAKALMDFCGLKQQKRKNEYDAAEDKAWLEARVERMIELYGMEREAAVEFVKESAEGADKYLM